MLGWRVLVPKVRSRFSNIVMLLSAIFAFVPVMAVDYLLDNYVRVRERAQLQQTIDGVAEKIQTSAYDAVATLRRIIADSPSLCTPTFINNVHREMGTSLYLKQVLVENLDGVQYCDAFGSEVKYSPLSESLSIPGHPETLTLVRLGDLSMPVIKVTEMFGENRQVSTFVPVLTNAAEGLLDGLKPSSMVRIELTSGTPIITVGDPTGYDSRQEDAEFVVAQAIAGEVPLRAEAAVPFVMVRSDYADLDVSFTIIACLMCGAFLFLALQYVDRKSVV